VRISKWLIVGLAVGAIALGAVACSSNKKSSSSATDTPSAETPSSTQGTTPAPTGSGAPTSPPSAFTTVVASQNATLGTILTTYDGFTLYTFDNDTAGVPTCTAAACANLWPPLAVPGTPTAGAGVTGTLGVAARPDGTQQVTYSGKPLYLYSSDSAAGATNGDGFGGLWHVVKLS
jgi:predicted lipoprotein with Yx(FWY)xxD motif